MGGGVETSLAWLGVSNGWSAKMEYLYVDLGTVANAFAITANGVPLVAAAHNYASYDTIHDHIIRVGLNYRSPARWWRSIEFGSLTLQKALATSRGFFIMQDAAVQIAAGSPRSLPLKSGLRFSLNVRRTRAGPGRQQAITPAPRSRV